jgi:hypothetical protein
MPEAPPVVTRAAPLLVAVDMGYGHRRAARALAGALGTRVLLADRAPLADPEEERFWARTRKTYETLTRASSVPVLGWPLRPLVRAATRIRTRPGADGLVPPPWTVRKLDRTLRRNLQGRLATTLGRAPRVLTTHFVPAHLAALAGCRDVACVVTDSDVHRAWVPCDPEDGVIRYLVPAPATAQRLRTYGVSPERIEVTGYPLPGDLLGGEDLGTLRARLAARLVRLDPSGCFRRGEGPALEEALGPLPPAEEGRPPKLTFAVGGAGAQASLPWLFLPSLRAAVEAGRLRLQLVAGVRPEVARAFQRALAVSGLRKHLGRGVEVQLASDVDAYLADFDRILQDTDVLWTKPSELTFYAALGIPLLLAPPIGDHEHRNGAWALERGAALRQGAAAGIGARLERWLRDGRLAEAAWAGFRRLPARGLHRIAARYRA